MIYSQEPKPINTIKRDFHYLCYNALRNRLFWKKLTLSPEFFIKINVKGFPSYRVSQIYLTNLKI